jgi:hypothetical protein
MVSSPEVFVHILDEDADWRHQALHGALGTLSEAQIKYRQEFWASTIEARKKYDAEFDRIFGKS